MRVDRSGACGLVPWPSLIGFSRSPKWIAGVNPRTKMIGTIHSRGQWFVTWDNENYALLARVYENNCSSYKAIDFWTPVQKVFFWLIKSCTKMLDYESWIWLSLQQINAFIHPTVCPGQKIQLAKSLAMVKGLSQHSRNSQSLKPIAVLIRFLQLIASIRRISFCVLILWKLLGI